MKNKKLAKEAAMKCMKAVLEDYGTPSDISETLAEDCENSNLVLSFEFIILETLKKSQK